MILFLLFFNLFAQEVVIQSEDTTNFQYEKHLNENPTHQSFIQYKQSLKNNLSPKMLSRLKKAQFEFLEGSLQKSVKEFQAIVDMRFSANWGKKEREAIHFSFLRLAQLEKNKIKRRNYLKKAYSFSPKIKANSQLFPPPLISEYNAIKKELKPKVWPLPEGADVFSHIQINGVKKDGNTSFVQLFPGTHRIQFLSNKYEPVHFVVNTSNIEEIKIRPMPLARGNCLQPQFSNQLPKQIPHIYLTPNCQGEKIQPKNTIPVVGIAGLPKGESRKKIEFYESKWFWIGMSVVAAGVLMHQNNKGGTSTQPNNNPQPQPIFTNK